MPRAVVFNSYGPPDVLELVESPEPVPGPGEILVRVEAAGVQPFDAMFRAGQMQNWAKASFPQRLGNEFAGTVAGLGQGVARFAIGDAVLGWSRGDAYADFITVPAGQAVPKPDAMSWPEAGAFSASAQTASTALDFLRLKPGETLLVNAAAGGVGSFAVQLAALGGVRVIGTASPANHDYLQGIGAEPVDYHGDLEAAVRAILPRGVDAALIAVGGEQATQASVALAGGAARVVTTVYDPSSERLGVRRISTDRTTARLAALTALYTQGMRKPLAVNIWPIGQAAEAHRLVESGHSRAKTALVTS